MALVTCGWRKPVMQDAWRGISRWRWLDLRIHFEAEEVVHLRDEVVEEAYEEPCEVIRGAEEEQRCSQAGAGVRATRMRQVVEDRDRAADSARMAMADGGLG